MSNGINKAIIVGNLGGDPEVKQTSNGGNLTTLNVATTTSWKDNNGNKQEKTEWHRVVMFNKLAEIAAQYLHKGSQVYIEGRISYRSYEQDGVTKYVTDIIAESMQMLGGKSGNAAPAPKPSVKEDDIPF